MTQEQLKQFENELKNDSLIDGSQSIKQMLEEAEEDKRNGLVLPMDCVMNLIKNGNSI